MIILLLAAALPAPGEVEQAIDRVCLPYTAPGGTIDAGAQAATAAHFPLIRREGETLVYQAGDAQLAIGTILGERFCQIEMAGDWRVDLTDSAAAIAAARGLPSAEADGQDQRWSGSTGSVYLSLESDSAPVTTLAFIGRE